MTMSATIESKKQPKTKVDTWLSMIPIDKIFNHNPNIAVIRLAGVISSNAKVRNSISFESLNPIIEKAFGLSKLAAICLVINSPGGSPVQSELIAKRIRALAAEKEVPVFSFIEDVGASGGYWLACAGDEIYASVSSIVGSIGVISGGFGLNEAISKLGIERRIYTSGKNKSILDPFMPEKQSDVKLIKMVQEQIHQHFIDYVKSRRRAKLTQTDDILFNGEFWTGKIAHDYGIIDGIDDLYSFIKNRFGADINLRIMEPKSSWVQNKLGIDNNFASDIVSEVESKSWFSRFGL
jgi:signal peptide peptidase SppA